MGSRVAGRTWKKKQVTVVSVLPGQPTDGSGIVCIHLFVQDERGPFVESHALHPRVDEGGKPVRGSGTVGPARGRLACDPRRTVAPKTNNDGVTTVTPRTDDPRGVSCLKCKASVDYTRIMELIEKHQKDR